MTIDISNFAKSESTLAQTDKYYPQPSSGNDTAGLASLLTAGQTDIQLRSGQYKLDAITGLVNSSNVRIRGAGINRTIVKTTPTTGNVFDLSGASFCEISDMTIAALTQRTAGAHFFLDAGGGTCQQNSLRRLWLQSSFKGIELGNCGTTLIEDVQIGDVNNAWGWSSALLVSAQAISTNVSRLRGGTAAGASAGIVRLNSANNDTFHMNDIDLTFNTPATGCLGLIVNGGTWMKFGNCSFEAGDQDAVTINGGTQVHMTDPHIYGRMLLAGGSGIHIVGGELLKPASDGLFISGGTDVSVLGTNIHDGVVGWNSIAIANGVNDFSIMGCDLGRNLLGSGGILASLIKIGASANAQDRYIVDLNKGRNFSGTALVDNGTGTNKRVGAVPTSNVFIA